MNMVQSLDNRNGNVGGKLDDVANGVAEECVRNPYQNLSDAIIAAFMANM